MEKSIVTDLQHKKEIYNRISTIFRYSVERFIPVVALAILFLTLSGPTFAQPDRVDLGADDWHRTDRHDGYVTGNGRIYAVGGLGQTLTRSGKSFLNDDSVSMTRLAWVVGPLYAVGNLGYGWELKPEVDGEPLTWSSEEVNGPAPGRPFWGVTSRASGLRAELTDIIVEDQPVLLRHLRVSRPEGSPEAHIRLSLPVYPDPRNGAPFQMWNGDSAGGDRHSVTPGRMIQRRESESAIVLVGAQRALWQEISTPIPPDSDYRRLFPPRALATSATSIDPDVEVRATSDGLQIDLGQMGGGEQRTVGVWLVTATAPDGKLEETVLSDLKRWKGRKIEKVVEQSRAALPEPLLRRVGVNDDPLISIIQSTSGLARATQAYSGCVLAQPYMYPMCYVRDQLGSFKVFLAQADYERAWRALAFYVAMQNRYGIQNAYDATPNPPDPTVWDPEANSKDGHHRVAEVPSIIILMARDYYRATGDLERVKMIYDRLVYNLRVQEPSPNGLLPSPGDESYTNSPQTAPKDRTEMTDSNLLYIASARFLSELADTLGHEKDAAEFEATAKQTMDAVMDRLWLSDGEYFVYARDASDDPAGIDRRPALDSMLRWFWLEMGDPLGHIPQANLETVLDSLVDPVRVVPEVYDFTAGMDPGYLLYALSRSQHPSMHDAADLMLRYASDVGLFAEYYEHEDGIITPFSGTLRPWESGINAYSLVQYFLGMWPNLPEGRIALQPHLPPDWKSWTTREIQLYREGTLKMTLKRTGDGRITFDIVRSGGQTPLDFEVEFGGFGEALQSSEKTLSMKKDRPDILEGSLTIPPTDSGSTHSRRLVFEVEE